jgi:hypothetical protein
MTHRMGRLENYFVKSLETRCDVMYTWAAALTFRKVVGTFRASFVGKNETYT